MLMVLFAYVSHTNMSVLKLTPFNDQLKISCNIFKGDNMKTVECFMCQDV